VNGRAIPDEKLESIITYYTPGQNRQKGTIKVETTGTNTRYKKE